MIETKSLLAIVYGKNIRYKHKYEHAAGYTVRQTVGI